MPARHSRGRLTSPGHLSAAILLVAALTFLPNPLHAQGCTQCLDNTAATPPATQRAYRHAIILLTLTSGGIFVGTLAIFKRHR